jgi:hypothetical protein
LSKKKKKKKGNFTKNWREMTLVRDLQAETLKGIRQRVQRLTVNGSH